MTSLQKFGYAGLASMFAVTQRFATGCGLFGCGKADQLKTTTGSGEDAIMGLIKSILSFVTIIAVVYCLWAGFQIMTAGGDEEKVKSGRKTIIQVIIGIVIMWLAYAIVTWVIQALAG